MDGRKHLRKRSPLLLLVLLLVLLFLLYLGFSFWGFELALLVKMTLNFRFSCPPLLVFTCIITMWFYGPNPRLRASLTSTLTLPSSTSFSEHKGTA